MRVETQIQHGVCVIRLRGRFVTGSDAAFVSARKSLQENGIAKAVVDLSEVPYIDSTGLAFIVDLHKWLESRGGQLVLSGATDRVRDVLDLTHIARIVPMAETATQSESKLRSAAC